MAGMGGGGETVELRRVYMCAKFFADIGKILRTFFHVPEHTT